MKNIIKRIKLFLPIIILIIWVILWINFIARDLFKKKYFIHYKTLFFSSPRDKIAYTYGKDFFELLEYTKQNISETETYGFQGVPKFSIEMRRAVYYMYLSLQSGNPDYIMVYDGRYNIPNYYIIKKLDNERALLKRY